MIFGGASPEKAHRVFAIEEICRPGALSEPVINAYGNIPRPRHNAADALRARLVFRPARPATAVNPHHRRGKLTGRRRLWQIDIEFLNAGGGEKREVTDDARRR